MSGGWSARSGTVPAAMIGLLASTALAAQTAPSVRDVRLSPDSIEIGDRFELRFAVALPEGWVVFLPDSVEAGPVESFGRVEWTASERPEDGTELSVVYPLIAFQTGSVTVPELDVFAAPDGESVAAGLSAPGALVGSWSAFREAPSAVFSARPTSVPERRIQVASVLVLDDITTQIAPRPPADVSGGDRDWLSTALTTLFGILLVGVAVASARDWMTSDRALPAPPPDPRARVLAVLDALLAEAPHREGRVRDFYAGWSDAARRYVEGFDSAWGPSWTSSELMTDLQGPKRSTAVRRALSADGIASEMRFAEEVKFGGVRPDAETAEAHWRTVRAWLAGSEAERPDGGPRP